MTHTEPYSEEIRDLKEKMVEQMEMAQKQHKKTVDVLENHDIDLAHEVIRIEKRVNSNDLYIDLEAERIIALYNPLATDLRLIKCIIKINTYNELIADLAKNISKFLIQSDIKYSTPLLEKMKIFDLYNLVIEMMDINIEALNNDRPTILKKVFSKDPSVGKFYKDSARKLLGWHEENKKNHKELIKGVELLLIAKQLETTGELCKDIAEEIVFYLEADVIKHKKSKSKIKFLKKIDTREA